MTEYLITVDLYCNWEVEPQAYRIYVDQDLLTERTYFWRNSEQYVQENIIVNIEPGQHYLKIEPVNKEFSGFYYTNFAVNKEIRPIHAGAFTVD
jgi:hypothetical protein